MIVETILSLGAWIWLILAAVLLVLELTAPGIFLMWFGMAAAATGLIVFRYDIHLAVAAHLVLRPVFSDGAPRQPLSAQTSS